MQYDLRLLLQYFLHDRKYVPDTRVYLKIRYRLILQSHESQDNQSQSYLQNYPDKTAPCHAV